MIRLIQRRLIIPRGDTGTFTVPVLATKNTGDVAVFSIIDTMTDKKVFEKIVNVSGDTMTIEFSHYDTVNLPVGKYVWDIKFYQNPEFMDGVLVNGVEVDSYYAAFTMPICEIRQTGDNLLMADDAPGTELTPDQLDILNAAVNETNAAKNSAVESASTASAAASTATENATTAVASAEEATAALNELKEILPSLAEVATSGSYNDLEDKPFIPSRVSDLTDDSGHYIKPANGIPASDLEETYLTAHQDISGKANIADLAAVATSGSYDDLLNKPTIPEVPVQDVQIEGTSILENGVANIPIASYNVGNAQLGLVRTYGLGIQVDNNTGELSIKKASNGQIKRGSGTTAPIVAETQHQSVFYGLAAAAGDTTQSQSDNAVGTYTDSAKTAIQQMLGVPSTAAIPTAVSQLQNDSGYLTSFTETDPTVPAWAKAAQKPAYTAAEVGAPTVAEMNSAISTAIGNVNSFDMAVVQELPAQDISTHTIYLVPKTGDTNDVYDEYVYINNAWEIVGNTQIDLSNYVQKTDYATGTDAGVIRVSDNYGLVNVSKQDVITGETLTYTAVMEATANNIKEGTDRYRIISSRRTPNAVFYGLAKAAGDSTQSQSSNAVGTYTDEAKAAIRNMIGAPALEDIPEAPVQDVQVNGQSIVDDGVANIPLATTITPGVVMGQSSNGVYVDSTGTLKLGPPSSTVVKGGTETKKPLVPYLQHTATFYGLAKAAGADMKDIANTTVGTYPDAQKEAIQSMLGITQMLAPVNPNLVATQAYSIGEVFAANGHLYKATAAIAQDEAIIPDTNCVETTMAEVGGKIKDVQVNSVSVVGSDGVADIPVASANVLGVIKADADYGTEIVNQRVRIVKAADDQIKQGTHVSRPITPASQHMSTFYGLAKASGDTTQSQSSNAVGSYTPEAKGAIQQMLGVSDLIATSENNLVASKAYKVGEVFTANGKLYKATVAIAADAAIIPTVEGEEVAGANCEEATVADGFVKFTDYATADTPGVVKVINSQSYGISIHNGVIDTNPAPEYRIKEGIATNQIIRPASQHTSVFYGLAKAAGADEKDSTLPVGQYTDTAKTAIRTMLGAVGTEDYASSTDAGVIKVGSNGITLNSSGVLTPQIAIESDIKTGTTTTKLQVPANQHISTFYGLAKASGDTTQSASSNAVGIYTDNAKASIKSMLGIQDGSTGTVNVSGTAPTIAAVENTRYVCGEVTSLNFTPPASGISIVRFTSGSSVTVLTIPSTVKFPEWFDPTALETNTIYEICVTDGEFGAVMSWAL